MMLLKETYGNSSDSSDEDFDIDDTTTRKRRKTHSGRAGMKSSNETPITKSSIHMKDENQKENEQFPKQTYKNGADGGTPELSAEVGSASTGTKRSKVNRLGETATQVFILCLGSRPIVLVLTVLMIALKLIGNCCVSIVYSSDELETEI